MTSPTAADDTLDVSADCPAVECRVCDSDLDLLDICDCDVWESCTHLECVCGELVDDDREPWYDEYELALAMRARTGDRPSRVRFARRKFDLSADSRAAELVVAVLSRHQAMLHGLAELGAPSPPYVISLPGLGDVDCLVMAPGAPPRPLAA